jgi:hypothetical protein
MNIADFQLFNHISIWGLQPLTLAAETWISEHLPVDALRHCDQIIVEPRYLEPILIGIEDDGLTLNQDPLFR